jgi:hypothetical protein
VGGGLPFGTLGESSRDDATRSVGLRLLPHRHAPPQFVREVVLGKTKGTWTIKELVNRWVT